MQTKEARTDGPFRHRLARTLSIAVCGSALLTLAAGAPPPPPPVPPAPPSAPEAPSAPLPPAAPVARANPVAPTLAKGEKQLVAVMPFNFMSGSVDATSRQLFEESVRTAMGDELTPAGYRVLTGDNTIRILEENGVDLKKACEATCALDAAKEMKARFFVSGTAASSEGEYTAFVRFSDAQTGQQLASVKVEGKTMKALAKEFEGKCADLVRRALAAAGK